MEENDVLIPVRCPECGVVALTAFPTVVAATALTSWLQMRLHSNCHNRSWDASATEIDSMRRYLGEAWLESVKPLLGPLQRQVDGEYAADSRHIADAQDAVVGLDAAPRDIKP